MLAYRLLDGRSTMKNQLLRLGSVLAAVVSCASVHAQNVLINGDFENEPLFNVSSAVSSPNFGYTLMTGNAIPGWTIAPNHAATIHVAPGPWPVIDGTYSLNTDGEGTFGNNVDIYQDFATTVGEKLTLGFLWEPWNLGSLADLEVKVYDPLTSAVLFDGLYPDSGPSLVAQSVIDSFVGNGDPLRLEIDENPQSGGNDNAFIVDDFSVVGTPAAGVPDSTGLGVAALGLLSLAAAGLKFRAVKA